MSKRLSIRNRIAHHIITAGHWLTRLGEARLSPSAREAYRQGRADGLYQSFLAAQREVRRRSRPVSGYPDVQLERGWVRRATVGDVEDGLFTPSSTEGDSREDA